MSRIISNRGRNKTIKLKVGTIPSSIVERQNAAALLDYRIYVDIPKHNGWRDKGRDIKSCRMFTDGPLAMLHEMAGRLGLRIEEFQDGGIPRYDISEGTRRGAIIYGAKNIQEEAEEQIAYARARRR